LDDRYDEFIEVVIFLPDGTYIHAQANAPAAQVVEGYRQDGMEEGTYTWNPATGAFLQVLRDEKAVRKNKAFVGILGVRVDPRTRAAATLEAFLAQFGLPILAYLRDSQIYPNAAFNGLSIFDMPHYMTERDREQWLPVLKWVAGPD
jgi:hypothetical protein